MSISMNSSDMLIKLVNQNILATIETEPIKLTGTTHVMKAAIERNLEISGIAKLQSKLCRTKIGECAAVCVDRIILVGVLTSAGKGTILTAWTASLKQIEKMKNTRNEIDLLKVRTMATPIYNILDRKSSKIMKPDLKITEVITKNGIKKL